MSKTATELLKDFIKANKNRRLQLAESNGFTNAEQYQEYLVALSKGVPAETKIGGEEEESNDVVIAFDTTGSMRSYIDSVKRHVGTLVDDMFANTPNLKMKLVAFGDYCDMKSSTVFDYAYQETTLTDSKNELVNFVNNARNTSGGDTDEFYELVIKKIVEETPWRNGKKTVLLIGDCNPHPLGYSHTGRVQSNQIDWRQEAHRAAKKGIQFDTLRIIPGTRWYEELSNITNGLCLDFKSSNKISEIIEASTYVRGGAKSKRVFLAKREAAFASGDEELIGAYKTMSSKL